MTAETSQEGAVAIVDILGFTRRASALTAPDARQRFLDPLFKSVLDAEVVLNRDFGRASSPIRLSFVTFADTAALMLPRTESGLWSQPTQLVDSLAFATALVVATCMWCDVPLRGALSYGEFMVCSDPAFVLGKAVFEAHELANRHEWAGVALCDSAIPFVPPAESIRCVPWDVPLKSGSERRLVVDWPAHSFGPSKGMSGPSWTGCFGADDELNITKKANTEKFFTARHSSPLFARDYVGPEQKEFVPHWREMYRRSRGAG